MPESYLQVSGSIAAGLDEGISEIARTFGALGSEFRPIVGACERVLIYLEATRAGDLPGLRKALENLGAEEILVEERESEDWLQNYRNGLEAFEVGRRWWIDPDPGGGRKAPSGRIRLVMEPRMAFGSGSHETTQLMLEAIEEEVVAGRRVLDVGSGSGILSLAALHCGAERVVGVDIDLQSVLVARQLLSDQDREFNPLYIAGGIESLADSDFELVLCNMLSRYFFPLLGGMASRLRRGGCMLLSGLLEEEKALVLERVKSEGLFQRGASRRGEWACLRLERV